MEWSEAVQRATRVVDAPGNAFFVQTAHQPDGTRCVRVQSNRDGHTTVCWYAPAPGLEPSLSDLGELAPGWR